MDSYGVTRADIINNLVNPYRTEATDDLDFVVGSESPQHVVEITFSSSAGNIKNMGDMQQGLDDELRRKGASKGKFGRAPMDALIDGIGPMGSYFPEMEGDEKGYFGRTLRHAMQTARAEDSKMDFSISVNYTSTSDVLEYSISKMVKDLKDRTDRTTTLITPTELTESTDTKHGKIYTASIDIYYGIDKTLETMMPEA